MQGGVTVTWEETTEEPFRPGGATIVAVLKPEAGESKYFPPWEPLSPPPQPVVPEENRPVVIDVETTGTNPVKSRIICISAAGLDNPDEIVTFYRKDEKEMVREFIDWFENKGYNQIVGYMVGFDFKFIWSRMLRYRIKSKAFYEADLMDLAQILAQGKEAFVYGKHKAGKLDDWAKYLLGMQKLMSYDELLKAYEQGRIEDVIEHNRKDVEIELLLYALIQYCRGEA